MVNAASSGGIVIVVGGVAVRSNGAVLLACGSDTDGEVGASV